MLQIEGKLGNTDANDASAGGTLTLDTEDSTAWDNYAAIRLTGSPGAGFTLNLPNRYGIMWILNFSGQTVTLNTVGGSTLQPTIPTAQGAAFLNRGDEGGSPTVAELHRLTANQAHS